MTTPTFAEALAGCGVALRKRGIEILQVNVGRLCNMTCAHCHVDAGPTKTRENMGREVAEAVIRFLERSGAGTLDLTGGAPELNPHFRDLVAAARGLGRRVIDRCNLTILLEEGMEDLADFLAVHRVEIVASLPCYLEENVDRQRGRGAFSRSVTALRRLNDLGYGRTGKHILDLVYNPVGPHLPPSQETLEAEYKRRLRERFGIVFDRLYTITNMPIRRYAAYLRAQGRDEAYRRLLIEAFNPATLNGLMCRNTLSVGWDGGVYDCDFNQMLGMALQDDGRPLTIEALRPEALRDRTVLTGEHCFGCTAGAGSSCQGALH